VCHRGASALAPENSLAAFRLAMHYGVDYSELDVFVAREGDLVVTHDAVDDPDAQLALPRLQDVFSLVGGRMGIYVELKGHGTGAALGALLANLKAPDDSLNLIVGSFVLELVDEVRTAAPHLPRSVLFGSEWRSRTDAMLDTCRAFEVTYAHPCFRPVDAALVEAFHAADLRVMTPHTNDAAEARYFADIGVDVIASDDPRILLPLRFLTQD
jgi:glycerophosphoryl diester phosphodiesterase